MLAGTDFSRQNDDEARIANYVTQHDPEQLKAERIKLKTDWIGTRQKPTNKVIVPAVAVVVMDGARRNHA